MVFFFFLLVYVLVVVTAVHFTRVDVILVRQVALGIFDLFLQHRKSKF